MAPTERFPVEVPLREGSRRHELVCLILALVVHVPILSLGAWSFIADMFHDQSGLEGDQDVEVPMELDLDNDSASKPDKKESKVDEVQVVPEGPDEVPVAADAGPPPSDAATPPDAAPKDAATDAPPPLELPDAATPPPKPKDQTPLESVKAPQNPSGNPNNVEIVLVGKVMRTHPVGIRLGKMLPNIKQWKDFFDDTGIDAVQDVDVMVIMGPQVIRSGQVDVMMVFNKPPDQIHAAVDKILGRSNPVGGWMDDSTVPAAQGKADGADRLFVLIPKQDELYVTPPPRQKKKNKDDPDWTDDEKAKALKEKIGKIAKLKAPSADVSFAIHLSVKEPGKLSWIDLPLVGKTQLIPDSFQKFVLRVDPHDDGSALVRIELIDDTAANAKSDLENIQAKYDTVQGLSGMVMKLELPPLKFVVEGRTVVGETDVPLEFLEKVAAIGEAQIAKAKH